MIFYAITWRDERLPPFVSRWGIARRDNAGARVHARVEIPGSVSREVPRRFVVLFGSAINLHPPCLSASNLPPIAPRPGAMSTSFRTFPLRLRKNANESRAPYTARRIAGTLIYGDRVPLRGSLWHRWLSSRIPRRPSRRLARARARTAKPRPPPAFLPATRDIDTMRIVATRDDKSAVIN